MPSVAFRNWETQRRPELNVLLEAHARIGGTGRGRRYTTQQLNFALIVAMASQLQEFLRDLHVEAVVATTTGLNTTASEWGAMPLKG